MKTPTFIGNIDQQLWVESEDEPQVPEGWTADPWADVDGEYPFKHRFLYRDGETRRLSNEQSTAAVALP